MRSALLCVFFALIVQKERSTATSDEFRPIPIPLGQWDYDAREARVGTLHEAINTEKPSTVAAVPAHYWEDALRHSVYLTLVRDKIDQLIANGLVVAPDSKPNQLTIKEDSDHDLWEKIKKAPFDRIEEEDRPTFGDVTIMAKGRLMDEKDGFRFKEDEPSKEDCTEKKCAESVKAFWSVKRVRQRDDEPSTGRYHYELTFSVHSQAPKKKKKPFENPVRTFTVRENPPDIIVATPRPPAPRPQKALWFHKNIALAPQARYNNQGLDRIFSSFFSDDEPQHVEPPTRYKLNPYGSPISQYSKIGYVGHSSDQQKRLMPYPYRPSIHKYPRPPVPQPLPPSHVQHHYLDIEAMANPHGPPNVDHRYISPSNIVKTTRPAVLPTPPTPNTNLTPKNVSIDQYNNANITESITKEPEAPAVYSTYTKSRPAPVRPNYFPEHIRPPVYNAPPGVFVTVEKKPFKPMPPLKFVHSTKVRRPIDFRPSPQVLDSQYSNRDSTVDSAFRPILMNFTESDEQERPEVTQDHKENNKHLRKQAVKKPPKKHENIKSQRVTTTAPDIITVNSALDEDNDTMQWANLLSAFTKTTPMEAQKESHSVSESSTEPMSSNEFRLAQKVITTTTTEKHEETTTMTTSTSSTTPKPKKRTRPPHKFVKHDKVKKHKRVTTTKAPEILDNKKTDLTPQASSAATGGNKSWKPKNVTTTTAAPSTTTTSTTTWRPPTTTQMITSHTPPVTAAAEATSKPTQGKNKNRFRQSTLMQKGTSVKHDRWSINVNSSTEKRVNLAPVGKSPPRRKGSNFQGYGSTSTSAYMTFTEEDKEDDHNERYPAQMTENGQKTLSSTSNNLQVTPLSTQPAYEDMADQYNSDSSFDDDQNHDDIHVKVKDDEEHEIEDHSEFIFGLTSTTPNDKTNEINEEDAIVTEPTVETSPNSMPKNKTRCKKKKHQHLSPSTTPESEDSEPITTTTTTIATTTKSSSDLDFLDEILGNLGYTDSTVRPSESKPELDEEESENHEKYLEINEDFEDFLSDLDNRNRHRDEREDVEYEDDERETSPDDDVSPFDNDDVNEPSKDSTDKEYDEYNERSYSLLELMAME